MKIDPNGTTMEVKPATHTLEVKLNVTGETPMEHEILLEYFKTTRSTAIIPVHVGADLRVMFTIADNGAFARAKHNLENRKRQEDGRQSLEQEAEEQKRIEAAESPAPKASPSSAPAASAATSSRSASPSRSSESPAKPPASKPAGSPRKNSPPASVAGSTAAPAATTATPSSGQAGDPQAADLGKGTSEAEEPSEETAAK